VRSRARDVRRLADRLRAPAEARLLPTAELGESRLFPAAAVVTAAALYATLPGRYVLGSGSAWLTVVRWLVPAVALALLPPLILTAPKRRLVVSVRRRTAAIALIAVISAASGASIVILVHLIVSGHSFNARELVRAAIHIWITSVLIFALWYWQLDSGGPMERRRTAGPRDFLFPQTAQPEIAEPNWQPQFLDYLYLSFTNATAFSPTDTMPLSRWAKMLMLVQSAASLLLLVMVAARAVNILR
jgi:uncharacterized membrane protein